MQVAPNAKIFGITIPKDECTSEDDMCLYIHDGAYKVGQQVASTNYQSKVIQPGCYSSKNQLCNMCKAEVGKVRASLIVLCELAALATWTYAVTHICGCCGAAHHDASAAPMRQHLPAVHTPPCSFRLLDPASCWRHQACFYNL